MDETATGAVVRKKKRRGLGPLPWFIALGISVLIAGGGWTMVRSSEQRAVQQGIASREMRGAFEELLSRDGDAQISLAIKSTGPAGALEKAAKTAFHDIAADMRAMRKEEEALGFPGVVELEQVTAEGGVGRARAAIAEERRLLERHRKLRARRLEAYSAEVARIRMPRVEKLSMADHVTAALEASSLGDERLWKLEDDAYAAMDASLGMLEATRGRWSVRYGGVYFHRSEDYYAFEKERYKIRHSRWQLEQRRRASLAKAQEMLRNGRGRT